MKSKRVLLGILCAALLLFSACGSTSPKDDGNEDENPGAEQPGGEESGGEEPGEDESITIT